MIKKKCAFPHARHFTGGRCRLPWRVLTLADEHYQVLKTLSTLDLHAEKKRQIPNGISKHFIH